jgi:hypothetical protein
MTTPDYRAVLAELLSATLSHLLFSEPHAKIITALKLRKFHSAETIAFMNAAERRTLRLDNAMSAARALLAAPEVVGVTDEELREMWLSGEWFNEGATFREFASIVRRYGTAHPAPVPTPRTTA